MKTKWACALSHGRWLTATLALGSLLAGAGCHRAPKTPDEQGLSAQGQTAAAAKGTSAMAQKLWHRGDSDAVFTNSAVLRIRIDIPRAGMSSLRRGAWGNPKERPVAKATITEGGVTYANVAVHLKGAAGSFRPVDDRPAMTLNFDHFVSEQSFHGLHKISLNNSVQDSSLLCEKIARELFLAAGVPVPRAAHALVTLNGRDLGLYVLLEGANKQFLKRHFENATGNLYDGGFCQDINGSLSVNSGDNPKNDSGLAALRAAIRTPRPDFARLDKVLDVDRFASMVAMEMLLDHWDGYSLNKNNWRVFHDVTADKMVFIPHGLDQLFGAGAQFDPGSPRAPQHISGDVTRAFLGTREGKKLYQERIGQLYTNVFNADEIAGRIDAITLGVAKDLGQSDPQLALGFQRQAVQLKQRIRQRGEILRRQFGPTQKPLELAKNAAVALPGWKPSTARAGEPVLNQTTDAAGKLLLHIQAAPGGASSASWRTRLMLSPGQYQFQGRLRLSGVAIDEGDTRGGAGLRISKGPMPKKLTGSAEWTSYKYVFTVEDEPADVELICELRASKGEAWFDAGSLRLVRVE